MTRFRLAVVLPALAFVVGSASAGWQFERVDTAGAGPGVHLRKLPDGRLCLCYRGANADLRYAYKDTIWHFEDIGPDSGGFGFSLSPAGVPAVLCGSNYIERTDTGWVRTTVPLPPHFHYLAHDSAGSPVYLRFASAPDTQMLIAVSRVDSVWVQDTAVILVMPSEDLAAYALRGDAMGRPVVLFQYAEQQGSIFYAYLNVAIRTDSGWVREGAGSTVEGYFGNKALGMDPYGNWGCALVVTGYLTDYWLCYTGFGGSGPIVRASSMTRLAVTLDSLDRPQVAFLQNEDLYLAWRDSTAWETLQVPWNYWVSAVDIAASDRNEPVIAMYSQYCIWLARADHVLSCGDRPESQPCQPSLSTVCRGVLNLDPELCCPGSPVALLDALGRRILDLHRGANDVSHLVPGVYYVRGTGSRAIARVVVTR